MKFTNAVVLREHNTVGTYWDGQEIALRDIPADFEGYIVGKVRPWDDSDTQYVLYEDGDIMLADLVEGTENE